MILNFHLRKQQKNLPDLSRQYMDVEIPAQQREIVNRQLKEMYAGRVVPHFAILREVFSWMDRPNRILDAGCGSGYYSEILKHLVPQKLNYVGCDYNPTMLRFARQYYPHLPFAQMDVCKLAWKNEAFEVVLSSAVIAHVREWRELLSELIRVTSRWIILHRTSVNLKKSTTIAVEKHYGVDVYRVYLREKELLKYMSVSGCRLISRFECNEGTARKDRANYTYLFSRDLAK